ncbi:MAG: hypothetical protein HUJ69_01685 [Lachnospiraceae bacterium]|nr:hypothetical protein [Lachnospiraceae bacterium]
MDEYWWSGAFADPAVLKEKMGEGVKTFPGASMLATFEVCSQKTSGQNTNSSDACNMGFIEVDQKAFKEIFSNAEPQLLTKLETYRKRLEEALGDPAIAEAMEQGEMEPLLTENESIIVFQRVSENRRAIIILNLLSEENLITMPCHVAGTIISNYEQTDLRSHGRLLFLQPNQAIVFESFKFKL